MVSGKIKVNRLFRPDGKKKGKTTHKPIKINYHLVMITIGFKCTEIVNCWRFSELPNLLSVETSALTLQVEHE